ncbi:uncharacterized protein LOC122034890 [Zingiber officinale]|uniref:Uncharacterized protein n=1 Tax=Zingiber officinale TaxID=94328 RepID=A0A8J5C5W4_ZINOF|nr:uncharacterized protein LOC122034890 [Zingiber officinale]KAG6468802.1 hypothetical protein ZIOFF_073495 [Zingiber officinale]
MLPIVVSKLPAPFSFLPMPLSPLFPLRIRVLSHFLPSSIQSKAKYSSMEKEQRAKDFQDFKYRGVTGGRVDGDGIADLIIPHLLKLYGSSATARDFEIYSPNAIFEDPLMCAHGVNQIKSAFYSLPKLFSESKIVEYTVEENSTGPGKVEILIDNKQHYKIFGKAIDLVSLIRLKVEEGKVVRHEDWWDRKPLKNRETASLALTGRLSEVTRRASMLITHVLMGFGKDPSN